MFSRDRTKNELHVTTLQCIPHTKGIKNLFMHLKLLSHPT